MERKLTLTDICGYFPYGLKILDFESEVIYPFLGYEIDTTLTKILLYDEETDWWDLSNFKPILRPLSDLYKPITHNGERIIPNVELAEIAEPGYNWLADIDYAFEDGGLMFLYRKNIGFRMWLNRADIMYVNNQYQLFDYLHELKIDYRGLIDAGLAVDCNTLKENPYK